jgi:hypothetical protein
MNSTRTLTIFAMAFVLSTPAMAQQKSPTEAQCREMVDGMVQLMKSTPIEKEKEKQDARELIERVEKVVRDNRSRGASECDSWAAIGRIVVHQ